MRVGRGRSAAAGLVACRDGRFAALVGEWGDRLGQEV
jgi:hypothetical protein